MRAAPLALLLASVVPAPSAGAALDAWTGTVEGSMIEVGHVDNGAPDPGDRLVTDDYQECRIRFTFGFRVVPPARSPGSRTVSACAPPRVAR